MRALITGSAGFLGRHLRRRLETDGWQVTAIDVAAPGTLARDCRGWFATSGTRYDLAVHCAAVIGGRLGIDGRPLALAENFELDAAYARWAARTRPEHVVYLSSSAAYPADLQGEGVWQLEEGGPAVPLRLREEDLDLDHLRQPDALYGLSKIVGETLMRHLSAAGVRTHVVRPFSGYGTDQALDYPFAAFCDRARRHEDPFIVWGDGEQVRDWIHVDDIVGAVLAMVDQDVPGPLNLGSGVGTSFNALAAMVTDAAGYAPTLRHETSAPQGVRYRVCDPRRMLEVYAPRVNLAEGIERALCASGALRR